MSNLIKRRNGVEWYSDGTILLIRCPKCKRENWALAVADGRCCWCGYQPKPISGQNRQPKTYIPRDPKIIQTRDNTVKLIVRWTQTGLNEPYMRCHVNNYMKISGANADIEGLPGIIQKRRIVANELLIRCITPLSREELKKAETMLLRIAEEDAQTETKPQQLTTPE